MKKRNKLLGKLKADFGKEWLHALSGDKQIQVYNAFINSRMMYSINLLASQSKTMNDWYFKYHYKALCIILDTNLKPKIADTF